MTNDYECEAYGERRSWCQCCVWPYRQHIGPGICDSKPIVSDTSIRVERRKSPTNQPNVTSRHGCQRPWGHGLTTKRRYTSIVLPKPCCIALWSGSNTHLASSESFSYFIYLLYCTCKHTDILYSWTCAKLCANNELLKCLSIHQEQSSFASCAGSKRNSAACDYMHHWECLIWFVHAILKTLCLTSSQAYAMSMLQCCVNVQWFLEILRFFFSSTWLAKLNTIKLNTLNTAHHWFICKLVWKM